MNRKLSFVLAIIGIAIVCTVVQNLMERDDPRDFIVNVDLDGPQPSGK